MRAILPHKMIVLNLEPLSNERPPALDCFIGLRSPAVRMNEISQLSSAKVLLFFHICKHLANFSVFNIDFRFARIKCERYTFIPFHQDIRSKRKKMRLRCLYHYRTFPSRVCGILTIFVSLLINIFLHIHCFL